MSRSGWKIIYSKSCPAEVFRLFFQRYEEIHRQAGLIDFDDMMTYTWELLNARPDILSAGQKRWSYILVDEFQDINLLQYRILQLLALPENNLFIVGDDDQSIYRFRGAKPEIMLNFPNDYPNAAKILLDRNFRSSSAIIHAAQTVITENKNRFEKQIIPVHGSGASVDIREFAGQEHESLFLIKAVQNALKCGTPAK